MDHRFSASRFAVKSLRFAVNSPLPREARNLASDVFPS